MDAEATVRAYYDALRRGAPLVPFFAASESVVKFGISERLAGIDAVADGLSEQTQTTNDWTVESSALRLTERDEYAWFSDDVFMAWTDTERDVRYEFDTRWSGTLERNAGAEGWRVAFRRNARQHGEGTLMVGTGADDNRSSLVRQLKLFFVALVGASAGLIAFQGGATLLEIALVVGVGLVVGAVLVRIVFPGTGETRLGR